jgi:C4-dicarboxylate-specific signal transduction histidine kinase
MLDDAGEVEFVGTVMDITDRKRADALRNAQADLARVSRLTTIGELTASVAHEVNQPLMATVTNASACVQLLSCDVPYLDEARLAAERAVKAGHRAGDVIRTVRALARKSSQEMTQFNINEVAEDVLMLLISERGRHDVTLETALAADLQPVTGERIQLQQVILDLIVNGIEAMTGTMQQPKMSRVSSQRAEAGGCADHPHRYRHRYRPGRHRSHLRRFLHDQGRWYGTAARSSNPAVAGGGCQPISQSAKRLRVSVHRVVG